jgi:hypothetical protein
VFVAAALLVVTAELGEAAMLTVAAVVVAVVVVLVAMMAGVLEATSAIRAVDVEATSAEGVVVETGGDDVASTCAEASRISKMLMNARENRTRRPIPATAMMFVFIFSIYLIMQIKSSTCWGRFVFGDGSVRVTVDTTCPYWFFAVGHTFNLQAIHPPVQDFLQKSIVLRVPP